MKRLFLAAITCVACITANAQRMNVESAIIALRESDLKAAKEFIDKAAVHEESKNTTKMWATRAAIYDTILHGPDYVSLRDTNTVEQFVIAARQCVETDVKKKETYCSGLAIIQSSFDAYNRAYDYLQLKDYTNAVKFFNYVIKNIPLDKDEQLKKNNLTENRIYEAIYRSAYYDQDFKTVLEYSQKLINVGINDPGVYYFNGDSYLSLGDTAKALEVLGQGRKLFPDDKYLLNAELNVYLKLNKTDILLNKLNEAIEISPDNHLIVYVRGNIYDKMAADRFKKERDYTIEADKIAKKAKNEKVPATKAKLDKEVKNLRMMADSMNREIKRFAKLAEADYSKSIELNPESMDGYYAMGAILNNYANAELADKINNIQATTQTEYDKKYAPLKKQQDELLARALKYFEDALAIVENMSESDADKRREKKSNKLAILESIKSVYGNKGDEVKFMEYKKLIETIEDEE